MTDPQFANGVRPNVTIRLKYLEDTTGSMTLSYDGTAGMVNAATYTLSSTNVGWREVSVNVSNALNTIAAMLES